MLSLLTVLRENNTIPEEAIKEALSTTGNEKMAIHVLLQKGLISSEEIAKARAKAFNLPYITLPKDIKIPTELFDLFSQELVKRLKIFPLSREGNKINVGIVEPENVEIDSTIDFISVLQNVSIKKTIISSDDFENLVKKFSEFEVEVKEALKKFGEDRGEKEKEGGEKKQLTEKELQRITEDQPITRIVDVILNYGIESGASDIHIEPIENAVRVRFRLDGKLKAPLFLPKDVLPAVISKIKILSNLRVDETRVPQDGRIHYSFGLNQMIDFRVAVFPTIEGEKVVLRILDPRKGFLALEELGLLPKSVDDVRIFMKRPFGAMLISGPTGSGKTTTLYSILKELNKEESNVVTLEDPVEYYLSGINQSQVRPEVGYDFSSGLREIVRQDPNIIMVGEIRDKETASLLIQAALTGHLVFSTIHTNDSVGIIPRLLDMDIDNFLIPSSLRLMMAQRLIPKLCQDCKESYDPPAHIKKVLERELTFIAQDSLKRTLLSDPKVSRQDLYDNIVGKKFDTLMLFKSRGCQECGSLGVKGRIAVYETLTMGPEFEKIVVESPNESILKKEALRQGMITMRQDAIIKALEGMVGIEGVLMNTTASYM